jgi:hypothetical protein
VSKDSPFHALIRFDGSREGLGFTVGGRKSMELPLISVQAFIANPTRHVGSVGAAADITSIGGKFTVVMARLPA